MYPPKQETYPNQPIAPPVIGAPLYPASMQNVVPQAWSSGLCDCGNDFGTCLLDMVLPVHYFWQNCGDSRPRNDIMRYKRSNIRTYYVFHGCQWIYSFAYRSKLRAQYSLVEDPCHDCLVHWCCQPCALCQEYRELQNRGFDMALGWQGNIARQQAVAMTAPPVQRGMMQ